MDHCERRNDSLKDEKEREALWTCLDISLVGDQTEGWSFCPVAAMEMQWRAVDGGGLVAGIALGRKKREGTSGIFSVSCISKSD